MPRISNRINRGALTVVLAWVTAGLMDAQAHMTLTEVIAATRRGILPGLAVLAPRIIDGLKRAHRIGVRLVFDSEAVFVMKGQTCADLMFDHLAVWREAGIPPANILRAMTVDAAELLRSAKCA